MANTWQGEFPRQNANADGFERASPFVLGMEETMRPQGFSEAPA
jgi:hypothetical protein